MELLIGILVAGFILFGIWGMFFRKCNDTPTSPPGGGGGGGSGGGGNETPDEPSEDEIPV